MFRNLIVLVVTLLAFFTVMASVVMVGTMRLAPVGPMPAAQLPRLPIRATAGAAISPGRKCKAGDSVDA